MIRGRVIVWAIGVLGVAALAYTLAMEIVRPTSNQPFAGLTWPLLGIAPILGVGLFFAAFSDNRERHYIVLSGAAMALGTAFESTTRVYPELVLSPWFALLNPLALGLDAVAIVAWTSAVATFPDGRLEARWQRWLASVSWLSLLAVPLVTIALPTLSTSGWADLPDDLPNPTYLPGLAWAGSLANVLKWLPGLGVLVFAHRALLGGTETRRRLRPLAVAILAALVGYGLWGVGELLNVPSISSLAFVITVCIYGALVAIPMVFIHGVFRHGAFGVRTSSRARAALQSSSWLIGLVYACAIAAPAVLLAHELTLAQAVVLTVVTALVLQPIRSRAQSFVRRNVLGDRDRELDLLVRLGTQLEQTAGLDDVLDDLSAAVRQGLRATWTRIRLLDEAGEWSHTLEGTAGPVTGTAAETHVLVRGGSRIGQIELGPKETGHYAPVELDLLARVSSQAATAVANVALAAQLEHRLAELSASRARLVVAQDDERRRIERDLHDGIQQNVVALIAGLRLARNRLDRGELDARELTELQEQARETLADLREIAHGIHPPVLGDNGLVAAVESRAARFPIPLDVVSEPELRRARFSAEVEATAYYVVSESLANVAKHAEATSATVTLSQANGTLRVVIADDGGGFDPSSVSHRGGLSNIRDRVAAAAGRLTVDSGRHGTGLTVDLPVSVPFEAAAPAEASQPVGARHG